MKHLNICGTKRAFLEIRPSNSSKTTKKSVKHKTMNVERGENIKVGQFKDKGEKKGKELWKRFIFHLRVVGNCIS